MTRMSIGLAAFALASVGCGDGGKPTEPAGNGQAVAWANVGKTCTASSPVVPLSAARRDSLPPGNPGGHPDAEYVRIARETPGGFGGTLYRDGHFTYWLVDPSQKAVVSAVLDSLAWSGRTDWQSAVVLKGRWDFAQMYDWYHYLLPRLGAGISFGDIDEAHNYLHFGAIDEDVRARVEALLTQLDVPCNLIVLEIQGYVSFASRGKRALSP